MIDIQFIRDNPAEVREKAKQKLVDIDIDALLVLDTNRIDMLRQVESLRKKRNENSSKMSGGKPDQVIVDEGKQLKVELAEREQLLSKIEADWLAQMKKVPNMPSDDTPIGASEEENIVTETIGEKPVFDFEPSSHWQIAQARNWLDKERGAKVAGSRFAYLKGELVHLQFGIVQYALSRLTDEKWLQNVASKSSLEVSTKAFVPIIPPMMLKTEIFDGMGRLEPRDQRYKVGEPEDDLWMNGSAEHPIGSMYYKETLAEVDMPIRYIGYATSFRREAGSYGKDMEGMLRMHQFDKLEMESFTTPFTSFNEHLFMIAIQKELMNELGLHYQVMLKCTADIGDPNARGVDINTWMPGQNAYRETHSADYMTDFQTRRMQTRIKMTDGTSVFAHTNDATALVLSRIPAVIIEQFQTVDKKVVVPEVLRPFMGGRELL